MTGTGWGHHLADDLVLVRVADGLHHAVVQPRRPDQEREILLLTTNNEIIDNQ